MSLTAIVLAAGEGKRMKSSLPKVLHRCAGRTLIEYVWSALRPLACDLVVVVTSRDQGAVAGVLADDSILYAVQDPPRGTADATRRALEVVEPAEGIVLVVPGDAPLLTTEVFRALLDVHSSSSASATVLTANLGDPRGYGRIVRARGGAVERIVEDRDATDRELEIHEANASVYVFDSQRLQWALGKIDDANTQKEFYLPDAIELLVSAGDSVMAYPCDAEQVVGVNSRSELAVAGRALRKRITNRLMDEGVTIVDPDTTYIDAGVTIGRDAVIHPNTYIEGSSSIGERAEIGPSARIVDSHVDQAARVSFAVVVESSIGPEATVGPFASLRSGTRLERGAKLGTFVEAKKSTLGEDSKANHLAYLGDAEIGRGVNVGAGAITCNWDGQSKSETVIEDDAYIGSDTMLVAPVRIGKRAATGAGAVVRGEVPDDALAVGVPARVIENKGNKMGRKPRADEHEGSQ